MSTLRPIFAIIACSLLARAADTGQLIGTVQDGGGKPVPNAHVSVRVRPPQKPSDPFQIFDTDVTADGDGKFTVTGLPPGRYAICAAGPDGALLPSCVWEHEITVSLVAGQVANVQPIRLQKAVDLYVRVNDQSGQRASKEGKVAGATLLLMVRSPNGYFVPIPATGTDAKGFDHHLAVPPDTDLLFIAYSQAFSLSDENGSPIDPKAGKAQSFRIPSAQGQHREVINIR